jgi:hypothetical protein
VADIFDGGVKASIENRKMFTSALLSMIRLFAG